MTLSQLLILWLVTSVSFFIISKLPTGVDIDSFGKAVISAAVFGILNALSRPLVKTLDLPSDELAIVLFAIIFNAIIFGLAAFLVPGFRLRWGIGSALLGSIALTIVNHLIHKLLLQSVVLNF
ncbi:MAG: phage holin family protein [Symploca sp. SIO3C6]|uniref:Phage holin family protein n=1 Tax=Symploca sp. SIO1C4 TaxID=2607765 RepID=A0A6B3N5G7_9CYAN|nr:phage holin family protein [Symploca sp. SIO3C6]NER26810.1 phage holin family protein [Symploca sp. SIO1C4]NET06399.1 phage holin family protein [Symploca sp. SIO2B6]